MSKSTPKQAPPDNVTPLRSHAERLSDIFPATTLDHATIDGLFVSSPGDPSIVRRDDGKIERQQADGTWQIRYRNHKGPAPKKLWKDHIDGKCGLVIGLLQDDGTTCVTVVDIDDYGVSPGDVASRIVAKTPLYVNTSKSGGPHIWAFHAPLSSDDSQALGLGILRLTGLSGTKHEIFPKAKRDVTDGVPVNGMNMPYLGGHDDSRMLSRFHRMTDTSPRGTMDLKTFLHDVESDSGRLDDEQVQMLIKQGRAEQPKSESKSKSKGKGKGKSKSSETKTRPAEVEEVGQREQAFSEVMLRQYARELGALDVGERSEPFVKKIRHLGNMVGAGWITRERVAEVILVAIAHWDDKGRNEDFPRHLKNGITKPHRPLPGYMTEDAVARVFAEARSGELRYDNTVKSWFRFIPGSHWKRLEIPEVFHEARIEVRALFNAMSEKEKASAKAKSISRVSFAAAVERFASTDTDAGIPVTSDAWNTDPYLLGTPGGTIDLRTVEMRPADPGDMISKVTAVAPAETEDCLTWLYHVGRITLGDLEYARFLQKAMGYTLLGHNEEELIFFLFGSGGNGKGKFVDGIAHVLGDYHFEAPPGMFTASNFTKPTNDLASARGARMLTSNENASDAHWDEELIKMFTGGSKVTARQLYEKLSTFRNESTPVFLANDKPRLKNVDDAMKRRMVMLPFDLKVITDPDDFDPDNPRHVMKDPHLIEKLRAEAPGILRWLLNGLRMYWEDEAATGLGLSQPSVVKEATTEFLLLEDSMGQFLEYEYERTGSEGDIVPCTDIFVEWVAYCARNNEKPGAQKEFTKKMLVRKYEKTMRDGYNVIKKIRKRRVVREEKDVGKLI